MRVQTFAFMLLATGFASSTLAAVPVNDGAILDQRTTESAKKIEIKLITGKIADAIAEVRRVETQGEDVGEETAEEEEEEKPEPTEVIADEDLVMASESSEIDEAEDVSRRIVTQVDEAEDEEEE